MRNAGVFGRMLVVGWLTTAAACSGGAPTPTTPPAATPSPETPAGTAVVASLPFGDFSWSPGGRYLLIGTQEGTSVYDRHGRLVSQFRGLAGWLDETHVIGPDGMPRSVAESQGPGYVANSWVVANGHGTAMIVVAVPGCVGDPLVAWYRNGAFDRAQQEQFTPFGFSPDGDIAVEGRMTCGALDGELHGWKGDVDLVELSNGGKVAGLRQIRGPMSFDLYGKSFSAQSDSSLIIATGGESQVTTLKNERMLVWGSEIDLALWGYPAATVTMDAPATRQPVLYTREFAVRSPAPNLLPNEAPAMKVTFEGRVLGVDANSNPGITTRLIDLTGEHLAIAVNPVPGPNDRVATSLLPRYWSPDGRMLALPRADNSQIVLVSVDPSSGGRFYETPLPWPSDWPTPGASATSR